MIHHDIRIKAKVHGFRYSSGVAKIFRPIFDLHNSQYNTMRTILNIVGFIDDIDINKGGGKIDENILILGKVLQTYYE